MKGYIYGGIAVAVLAILAGVFFGAKSYIDGVDKKAFERGEKNAEDAYRKRDNEQLQAVTAELEKALKRNAELEADRNRQLADREMEHARKVAEIEGERDVLHRDIDAGRLVWRDPGQTGACPTLGDQRAGADAAADPRGGDRSIGGGGLSREAENFLVDEATRANKVTAKLNLCRDTLRTIYGRDSQL